MAKAKNTKSLKTSLETENSFNIDEALLELEKIETTLSEGNIPLNEQLTLLEKARELHKKILNELSEIRTHISNLDISNLD